MHSLALGIMGNTLPITNPPKPTSSRAVILMELDCVRTFLRDPWRRPVGKLQIIGSTDEVPSALDGVIPVENYRAMLTSLADQAAKFKGGRIHIGAVIFQAGLFIVIFLGLILSLYIDSYSFFNPIIFGILGTLELGVLSQSGRVFQREEKQLKKELLDLFRPWRQQYSVVAKIRKTKGQIAEDKDKTSSTFYCLVLEKMRPDDDADTVSISTFTDVESEIDSEV